MRYTLIFLLVFFVSFISNAQYFNKRYDFASRQDGGKAIIEVTDGYISAGTGEDSAGNNNVGLIKIDVSGSEIWKKTYSPPQYHSFFTGGIGSMVITSDGNFLCTGSITDTLGVSNLYLFKFDENGDSLWFQEFNLGNNEIGYSCVENGGNYVVIGENSPASGTSDMLILKCDAQGNYLWHQTYGGGLWEIGNTVVPCFDGGYILGGYSNSFTVDNNYDNFVVKTDSLGNEEWSKTFGGPFGDGSAHVIQTLDSNYVVASKITKYELSGYPQSKARLIKLDSIGSIIWSKEYGSAELGGGLLSVKELSDGNILALGQGNDGLGSPSPANGYPHGVFLKTNSEGDSLWYRIYEHCTDLESHNYLRHFLPTTDGGIIACGFVFPSASCGGTQDRWVLKLDEDGNETGFEEPSSNNEEFKIKNYPNPFSGSTVIEVTSTENGTVIISDLMGRTIKTTKVTQGISLINIGAQELLYGVYYCNLLIEGKTVTSWKMIKM